jgi:CRISPR-associated endonuclease/helicase Cas3
MLTAVNPAPACVRTVTVERISAVEQAVRLIAEAAQSGAACIWVRNAVDDAIAAVDLLHQAGTPADLLHARFALCDRLHHEDRLEARFGKDGQARAGRVLVATQVAEQSLDLDFDVMVSDIAPIGSLIQCAGRLWRHMALRPAATRPVPGPRLTVLSPDPAAEISDRWLHTLLDRGAYVYDPTVVWRSARALFGAGQNASSDGVRALIGAVEGDAPLPLPPGLQDAEFRHEGREPVVSDLGECSGWRSSWRG